MKILESNSWLHAGPPKIRQYDWELSRWFLNFLQAWCHKQELVERDWRASQRVLELLPCLVHVTSTQACCDSLYSSGDSLEEINGEGCSFSCVVRKCHLSWAALCDRRKINEEVNFFMIAIYGFFLFSLFFFFFSFFLGKIVCISSWEMNFSNCLPISNHCFSHPPFSGKKTGEMTPVWCCHRLRFTLCCFGEMAVKVTANGTTVLAKHPAAVLTTHRSCCLVYIAWRGVLPKATTEKLSVV